MKAMAARFVLFLLATGTLIAAPLLAATYKWVDEKGNVHYTQTPPPGRKFDVLRDPAPVKQEPTGEAPANKDNEAAQKSAAEDKVTRETMCLESKERLTALENNAGKLVVKQSDGTMHKLSEEERQNYIKETTDRMKEICNPPH